MSEDRDPILKALDEHATRVAHEVVEVLRQRQGERPAGWTIHHDLAGLVRAIAVGLVSNEESWGRIERGLRVYVSALEGITRRAARAKLGPPKDEAAN